MKDLAALICNVHHKVEGQVCLQGISQYILLFATPGDWSMQNRNCDGQSTTPMCQPSIIYLMSWPDLPGIPSTFAYCKWSKTGVGMAWKRG